MNAFTESLALELRAFNIRVGLILPGRAPQTRFGENARRTMGQLPESYAALGQQIFDMILDVASGTKQPYSDQYGFHNDMCIFNPAPIT